MHSFLRDGRNAYIIDFDFARPDEPESVYVEGYLFDNLPRHRDARAGKPMKQFHDVYAYWVCYLLVCGETVAEGCSLPDNVETMEQLIDYIEQDNRTVYGKVRRGDIPELGEKTGTPGSAKS